MKRHLQCAEQQASPSNLTKYCAQNLRKICRKQLKRHFQCAADSSMIRTWSDHELVISHPPVRRGYFSPLGNAFCIENYNISRSGYLPRFHRILRLPQKVALQDHQILRLPRKVTLQDHQILRLPRKMTLMIDVRHTWHVIYNARSNRSHPPTSPNAAPATQNDSHHLSSWNMKHYLQCAEGQASPANLTKWCACHEKWHVWLILVTYETSFTMRGATGITLQPHQILRLPRKIVFQNLRKICRKQLKRQFQCAADSTMIRPWTRHLAPARSPRLLSALRRRILYWKLQHFALRLSTQISPNTAPATKSDTPRSPNTAPATKSATPRSRNTAPATKSDTPRSPNTAPATKSDTDLWLYWAVTELLLNWAVSELLLNCYWAELLLNCYWTVTELLLSCYWTVTELLLSCYWAVTELLLNCSWAVTELLLSCYWTVTEPLLILNWAVAELLLNCYWTVTELNCYWTVTDTELSCYWAVTELLPNCYWAVTELLLSCYWTVTEPLLILNWAVTELLLSCYWTVTELDCYWTELLLHF